MTRPQLRAHAIFTALLFSMGALSATLLAATTPTAQLEIDATQLGRKLLLASQEIEVSGSLA
ncbi:MAG: hypothetical protein K8J08_06850, partial [Thermoanaerobaculia bacterium]|nr:hypothetical protein [Thermoanaerobaculia bacterium]